MRREQWREQRTHANLSQPDAVEDDNALRQPRREVRQLDQMQRLRHTLAVDGNNAVRISAQYSISRDELFQVFDGVHELHKLS